VTGSRAVPISGRPGIYTLLEAALPGCAPRNIGVILIDCETGRGWLKLRRGTHDAAGPEDAGLFERLEDYLRERMRQDGAQATLEWMQDTLSNVLRIGDSGEVRTESFTRALERLYRDKVDRAPVLPFKTHLPLYTLKAAAGQRSGETPVETEDWIPAPDDMKLDRKLFAAHVAGHSMEPRIPDGSLNLFRFNVDGSRQGKIVLVERFDAFDETARYGVKRYASGKVRDGDGWRRTRIRFEPLNPDYEPWDVKPGGFAVIAEWLRVIE
jgi:SOS-response transcriptional repressor LexA